jgi:hypothetical protein
MGSSLCQLELFKEAKDPVYFDGVTYDPKFDRDRLEKQLGRVYTAMAECPGWMTLQEISVKTGDPEASVSARIRDLRKDRFGGYNVERRRRTVGEWEYHLVTFRPQQNSVDKEEK